MLSSFHWWNLSYQWWKFLSWYRSVLWQAFTIPRRAYHVEHAHLYKTKQKGRHSKDISLSLIYSSMSSAFKHKANKQGHLQSRPCIIHQLAKLVGWTTCRGKKTIDTIHVSLQFTVTHAESKATSTRIS